MNEAPDEGALAPRRSQDPFEETLYDACISGVFLHKLSRYVFSVVFFPVEMLPPFGPDLMKSSGTPGYVDVLVI